MLAGSRENAGPESVDQVPLPRRSDSNGPRFYSVAQVARILGMSSVTLYRAIAAGEFPAVRIRGRLIVPARAVEAMADAAVDGHAVVDAAGWTVPTSSRQA